MAANSRNPLIFIFITRLIDAVGFGIIMPVLPQLLLDMGAASLASATRIAGILLVTYAVLQFFFGPVIGNLSDRFGRRPVILTSLFAFGLDYFLMGFAPTIGWLFLGRVIAGIAGAVYVPANAFVADVSPPEKRAQAFGMMGAAFGVGFIVGPAIGGLLGELGTRAPFFAAALLAGVNLIFGLAVLPESLPRERRRTFDLRRANPFGAAMMLRRFPTLLGYAAALTLYLIANNVYPSTWAFFMIARFDWSSGMIGLSLAVTGLAMAVVQGGLTGKIVRRTGETNAALLGAFMATAAALAYAFATHPWMVFVVMVIGALQAVAFPALNALMTQQIPADAQGELQGGIASLMSLASVAGPLVMTQTLAYFTAPEAPIHFPGAAFVLAAILNVVGLWVLLTTHRPPSAAAAASDA